ncbi:MAG: type IV secretory system conjugative DNA transfer family protein, partial [Bacilli bacterium]
MEHILLIILSFASLILIFFYIIEPKILKVKINNENEYGSARFATFNDINKMFKKEKVNNIQESGFPVWYSRDNKTVWFDRETPHYVYLGSTGSGKSVTAVIPACTFIANAKVKRSVFVTDPKAEIFSTTSEMFKNNGYKIYTIDFRNPELSNKINLLEPIIREYEQYMKYDSKTTEIEN